MSFEIKNNELLEKYNKIWAKLNNIMEKAFDAQMVFAQKYLKIKLIITVKTIHISSTKKDLQKMLIVLG